MADRQVAADAARYQCKSCERELSADDLSIEVPSACSSEMEWRRSSLYPLYFVSEFGDVVSVRGNKALKGFVNYDGYLSFKIERRDGKKTQVAAHQLVAFAYLGPQPSAGHQVRHLNGSRVFNHFSNLRWGTAFENREDTRRHGTSSTAGERNPKAKLTESDVRDIRRAHRDIKEGRSRIRVSDLARKYDLHIATVCKIASRKSWDHVD